MHVACLLSAAGRILFPFLSPHGEAHRSSHILTVPVPGWLCGCVVGWVIRPRNHSRERQTFFLHWFLRLGGWMTAGSC
jgi:hypothetical protein